MNPVLIRLVVMIAVFASIFLLSQVVIGSILNRRSETRAVNRRLQLLRAGESVQAITDILRKNVPDLLPDDAHIGQRLYHSYQRQVRMAAVGFRPDVLLFACTTAFIGLISGMLVLSWLFEFRISAGLVELITGVSAAAAFGLPILWIGRRAEKRRKRMEEQFPIALDIFTRALRAGHPVASAIDLLTNEMEDPLGSEFGLVADEVSYGANLNDALMRMGARWDLADIRMFVTSLSLQSETGGNLAEILANLSNVIRERASMYMKVRALSSEGRMSGWMLTVLPVITLLSMFSVNPGFYLDVAGEPAFIYGFTGLIALYIIGVLTIRRMVDLKV
jgi:tight adherence protein B